jgi:hypothetical protein
VLRVDGPVVHVRTERGDYRARRATSCLLEPRAGDRVLLASGADGRCYVLAVLEREEGAGAELSVDGDLSLAARAGQIRMVARDGVSLASGGDVDVVAGGVNVNAAEGSVVVQRLTYVGRLFQSEIEKVKSFAGSLDMVLDRFTQKVKRSYRFVEELDHKRAGQVEHTAEKTMSLRGKNTLVTAEQLVKVDGGQIHFG